MKGYEFGKPFYQANVWIVNDCGDPLLLEEFTTKKEAILCIIKFLNHYNDKYMLDCFIRHFDEDGFCDFTIDVDYKG